MISHSSSSETSASGSLNASLQDVAIASDDQQQQQQEEEEEEFDAELKDLIAADTDSMDNEELRDHIRRLTSELIDQMHTINELNAHLNRQVSPPPTSFLHNTSVSPSVANYQYK